MLIATPLSILLSTTMMMDLNTTIASTTIPFLYQTVLGHDMIPDPEDSRIVTLPASISEAQFKKWLEAYTAQGCAVHTTLLPDLDHNGHSINIKLLLICHK